MRGGEEVKISKRAGSYVTLRDLIDEVGPRRGALLPRVAQGRYGIRVRHRSRALAVGGEPRLLRAVRACARAVGAAAGGHRDADARAPASRDADLSPLDERLRGAAAAPPRRLPRRRSRAAARELAPHQITFYLKDLAQEFHSYYNAERFLVDDAARAATRASRWSSRRARCCATASPCSASARRTRCDAARHAPHLSNDAIEPPVPARSR